MFNSSIWRNIILIYYIKTCMYICICLCFIMCLILFYAKVVRQLKFTFILVQL